MHFLLMTRVVTNGAVNRVWIWESPNTTRTLTSTVPGWCVATYDAYDAYSLNPRSWDYQ